MKENRTNTIAFVNFSKTWGGGEAQHLALAMEMISQGIKAVIITQENSELEKEAKKNKIPTLQITTGKLSFLNPLTCRKIRQITKKTNPDALILNASLELKHFAFALNSKHYCLIYRRGYHTLVKDSLINRYCIKKLTHLVAISEFIKKNALKAVAPYAKKEITIINNGISPLNTIQQPDYSTPRIVAVGRLVEYKQFDILIKAMPLVLEKIPNANLWIIGEGEKKRELEQLSNTLNVEDNVILKGFSNNVPALLSECSLFVHPAKEEAFGVVFLEAMRQQLPCVSFKGHAGDEIIEQNKTGIIIEEQSPQALAQGIINILENRERLMTMGKNAGNRFINNYTIESSVKKYLSLIYS